MFAVLASTPEVFTGNMGFSPGAVKALGAPLPDGTVQFDDFRITLFPFSWLLDWIARGLFVKLGFDLSLNLLEQSRIGLERREAAEKG